MSSVVIYTYQSATESNIYIHIKSDSSATLLPCACLVIPGCGEFSHILRRSSEWLNDMGRLNSFTAYCAYVGQIYM